MRRAYVLPGLTALLVMAACYEQSPTVTPANEKEPATSSSPRSASSSSAVNTDYPAATVSSQPASVSAPSPTTAPPVIAPPPPAQAAPEKLLRGGLKSTGVPACDAYLARVEICSVKMLSTLPDQSAAGPGLKRITDTLDLSRRTWTRAAASPQGRESLLDECTTSLRTYDDSVGNNCPQGTQ